MRLLTHPLGVALLSPVLLAQALWVVLRATRLPEADGPRQGVSGQGPDLHVLVLGDSSAAGVGVETQEVALGGQLVAILAERHRVHWQISAKSGATTASCLKSLADLPDQRIDYVVVALGVNDVKNGVGFQHWMRTHKRLIDALNEKFKQPGICLSGLPPLGDFPLLPWPLSVALGARATRFDRHLYQVAQAQEAIHHLPMDLDLDISAMAADGFHPGPQVYAAWAARVADLVAPRTARQAGARANPVSLEGT